jgi:hypothetical protein
MGIVDIQVPKSLAGLLLGYPVNSIWVAVPWARRHFFKILSYTGWLGGSSCHPSQPTSRPIGSVSVVCDLEHPMLSV